MLNNILKERKYIRGRPQGVRVLGTSGKKIRGCTPINLFIKEKKPIVMCVEKAVILM